MSLTRRLVAVVAALLQLTLPLAGYARTAFVPGADDICTASADRHADRSPAGVPAGKHVATHCALCAHGTPPALTTSLPAWLAPASASTLPMVSATLLLPQRAPMFANARAPPAMVVTVT